MWVFKHFPIENIHPFAFSASIAAECAAQQDSFWKFHHRFFAEMSDWSRPDNKGYFMALAAEYELDIDAFESCLGQDESALAVQSDLQDGMPFVRGTPTFVVLYGGEGRTDSRRTACRPVRRRDFRGACRSRSRKRRQRRIEKQQDLHSGGWAVRKRPTRRFHFFAEVHVS